MFGTLVAQPNRKVPRKRLGAHKISSQHDEIGSHRVGVADNCIQKSRLGEFMKMKIADLHDLHAGESVRQPGELDRQVDDFEFVARDFTGIERQPRGRARSEPEKIPSGEHGVAQ